MWVLEELGGCWQAGRQLALATEAWAVERGDLEDSSLAWGRKVLPEEVRQDGPLRTLPPSGLRGWAGRMGEPNAAILIRRNKEGGI